MGMAKCTECLHWDACLYLFKLAIGREPNLKGNRAEEKCPNFQCRTKYAEVVRCKDCKHLKYGYQCYNPLGISLNNDGDAYVLVDADDFCSCGERKDNGEEEKDG